jgi:hypothetical protein
MYPIINRIKDNNELLNIIRKENIKTELKFLVSQNVKININFNTIIQLDSPKRYDFDDMSDYICERYPNKQFKIISKFIQGVDDEGWSQLSLKDLQNDLFIIKNYSEELWIKDKYLKLNET